MGEHSTSRVVRARSGGPLSFFSFLSCCSRSSVSKSIIFKKSPDDSVHVMIKQTMTSCCGQSEKSYNPRAPLAERLSACRKYPFNLEHIEVTEEEADSEIDKELMADAKKV